MAKAHSPAGRSGRRALVLGGLGSLLAAGVRAQSKDPIRMLVGFSAGSATDVVARVVAQALAVRLGQAIVVENKTGVGGSLAADFVAKAKPDGNTLLFVSSAIAVNSAVYPKLPFDPVKDLVPISLVGRAPVMMLVDSSLPTKTVDEFVALCKSKPDHLNFGSSGPGGSIHMISELFTLKTGIKLTHVPYRGNGDAAAALLGGQIQMLMDTAINATPHLASPKVRALAITGAQRSPLAPSVPTFKEQGYDFEASVFFGLMGPAKLPAEMVARLNMEVSAVLKTPDVAKRLVEVGGLSLAGGPPGQFAQTIGDELQVWEDVAKKAKVVVQ